VVAVSLWRARFGAGAGIVTGSWVTATRTRATRRAASWPLPRCGSCRHAPPLSGPGCTVWPRLYCLAPVAVHPTPCCLALRPSPPACPHGPRPQCQPPTQSQLTPTPNPNSGGCGKRAFTSALRTRALPHLWPLAPGPVRPQKRRRRAAAEMRPVPGAAALAICLGRHECRVRVGGGAVLVGRRRAGAQAGGDLVVTPHS
jgi:hypothetical protein